MEQQQDNSSVQQNQPDFEGWARDNRARFIEADSMPYDKVDNQRTSPFVRRRNAQIELIREMWAFMWPGYPMISKPNARRLLRVCNDWVEEALDWTAHCAPYQFREGGVNHPPEYVLDVIKNEMKVEGYQPPDPLHGTDQDEEDSDAA